jgi:hypothetical protein
MTTKKYNRERLREILEKYDGNMRMFETLRSNSYEHALAAHSLDDLELFYSKIFEPGVSLRKTAATCPPWPKGTRRADEPPKVTLLENIHNRFLAERGLAALTVESERADAYCRAVKALPVEGQLRVLDMMLTTIGHEVISGKMAGLPISKQLQPVDRFVARQKLALREGDLVVKKKRLKLEERKVRVQEKKYQAEVKSQAPEKTITKEGWEQIERDLKLL